VDQFTMLQAAGCTNMQGYYFARPLPVGEIDLANPIASPAAGDTRGQSRSST
jgi:EAL domain-containing protein (putative c-di-GMP-specific phosphodiesterase class I)